MTIWRMKHETNLILSDGVHAFYLNALLRSMVFGLVRIFIPVFLYKIGLTMWGDHRLALMTIAGYYIILRLVVFLLAIPISKLIERIGFRRSIAVSVVFLIVEMVGLYLANDGSWWLLVAAISSAVNVPFYWIARDSALSQDAPAPSMGRALAVISTLEQTTMILAPLLAGLIIEYLGFPALFVLATLLLLVSVVPLWWMPHHAHTNGVSLRGFFSWVSSRRYFHQGLGIAGATMQDYGLGILWPVVLFLMGIQLRTLGALYSVVAVVTLVLRYLLGGVFDKLRAQRGLADELWFAIASLGSSMIWIVRLFLSSVVSVFVVDSLAEVFQSVYYGFHAGYAHLGGKRMGSIAFWVYGEMVYSLAAILFMGLLCVGAWYGIWKELIFLSISLWVLASMIMGRESNLK